MRAQVRGVGDKNGDHWEYFMRESQLNMSYARMKLIAVPASHISELHGPWSVVTALSDIYLSGLHGGTARHRDKIGCAKRGDITSNNVQGQPFDGRC